jgi:hypothetical protein
MQFLGTVEQVEARSKLVMNRFGAVSHNVETAARLRGYQWK